MFISKASRIKQNKPSKKTGNSKTKILKQKQPKGKAQPKKHQSSTLSLLYNHNASQSSLMPQYKQKLSAGKCLRPHRQSSANLANKSSSKVKNKGKKSMVIRKSPKKSPPSHKKHQQHPDQIYERIIVGQYKSITNSEINFSNNTSERDLGLAQKYKKNLTIDCSDDYILSQYYTSSGARKIEKRRNEAAIKIQKVFRGYLTRKMLENYILKQEARLQQLSLRIKKTSRKSKDLFRSKSSEKSHIIQSSHRLHGQQLQQLDISIKERSSTQKVNHDPLLGQSSIYDVGQDSLSKYLPDSYIDPDNSQAIIKRNEYQTYEQALQDMYNKEGEYNFLYSEEGKKKSNTLEKIQQAMPTDLSEKKLNQDLYFQEISLQGNITPSKNLMNQSQQSKIDEEPQQLQNIQKNQSQLHRNNRSREKEIIKILKKGEQQKWGTIIHMLNQHIQKSSDQNQSLQNFMSTILDYSKKNKEELEKMYADNNYDKNLNDNNKRNISDSIQSKNNEQTKIDEMLKESDNLDRLKKNQDMPLMVRKNIKDNNSSSNIYEKTEELKKYFLQTLTNYPVQQMVEIRQKALQKRQKAMVNKLNEDLQKSQISHEDFLARLSEMQEKFKYQKQIINRAKLQIFMGHKAVNKLVQDSFLDAKYLGFNVSFCRSLKDIKNTGHVWIKQIVVDQLKQFSKSSLNLSKLEEKSAQKHEYNEEVSNLSLKPASQSQSNQYSIPLPQDQLSYNQAIVQIAHQKQEAIKGFEESFHFSDDQSDDLMYTGSKFKRISPTSGRFCSPQDQNYSIDLFDNKAREELEEEILGKISINRRIWQSKQQTAQMKHQEMTPRNSLKIVVQPKKQFYNVQFEDSSSAEEQMIFNEEMGPSIQEITEAQIAELIWEATGQIFANNRMCRKFSRFKNRSPRKIQQKQRLQFISSLYSILPSYHQLIHRLNQKMTPSKRQLLKYMRVSLDDENSQFNSQQQQEQFQQIGKYELVFSSQLCLQAISFHLQATDPSQNIEQNINEEQIKTILNGKVSNLCIQKVIQREKFQLFSNKQQIDLRDQIKKIEMHCIFDALNETIVRLRLKSSGYTGIGLNQLTSLMSSKENQIQSEHQVKKLLQITRKEVQENMGDNKSSREKLLVENYDELCRNDSQWIQYADQALSFGMQLNFMLEDQFFFEQAKIIQQVLGMAYNLQSLTEYPPR